MTVFEVVEYLQIKERKSTFHVTASPVKRLFPKKQIDRRFMQNSSFLEEAATEKTPLVITGAMSIVGMGGKGKQFELGDANSRKSERFGPFRGRAVRRSGWMGGALTRNYYSERQSA